MTAGWVGSQCAVVSRGGRERERRMRRRGPGSSFLPCRAWAILPAAAAAAARLPVGQWFRGLERGNRAGWRTGRCVADLDWLASRGMA